MRNCKKFAVLCVTAIEFLGHNDRAYCTFLIMRVSVFQILEQLTYRQQSKYTIRLILNDLTSPESAARRGGLAF